MPRKPPAAREDSQAWLFKTEPVSFSIQDLAQAPRRTTFWDGVRNYQARNFLRDMVRAGDRVLIYHSNTDPLSIVGSATVVRAGYPDHTAFDPHEPHYDPKSDPETPTWFMVDIRLQQVFPRPVTRDELQESPVLKSMVLLQKGSRLSIQPVTPEEWREVERLAGVRDGRR